jgi:hypothetical protein
MARLAIGSGERRRSFRDAIQTKVVDESSDDGEGSRPDNKIQSSRFPTDGAN